MVQSLLISSTRKSSGKTIISIGLSGLANDIGYDVQTFKKGPDFIDPSWLTLASSRPCYNLDFNTMSSEEIKRMYLEKSHGMGFSLIEGTKGLFDGISTDGADSNARLASLLKSQVLLVIDCEGITRGIAPLLEGYKSFGKKLKLNKVILNNVSTSRHESKLISAISRYTDFRVLGVIPSIKLRVKNIVFLFVCGKFISTPSLYFAILVLLNKNSYSTGILLNKFVISQFMILTSYLVQLSSLLI